MAKKEKKSVAVENKPLSEEEEQQKLEQSLDTIYLDQKDSNVSF